MYAYHVPSSRNLLLFFLISNSNISTGSGVCGVAVNSLGRHAHFLQDDLVFYFTFRSLPNFYLVPTSFWCFVFLICNRNISPGSGVCGVAVVRVTGANAARAMKEMTSPSCVPRPRCAVLRSIVHPTTSEGGSWVEAGQFAQKIRLKKPNLTMLA